MERKLWLPIAAVLTLIGGILIAIAGPNNFPVAAIGSIITFFGFNLWVPITYTWSTENYPTRARATGFALVDGIGHLGVGWAYSLLLRSSPPWLLRWALLRGQ